MKLPRRLAVFVATLGIALIVVSENLMAMFASLTDAELLQNSSLIVEAEYLGQSEVRLGAQGSGASLGVLRVRDVLKGEVPGGVVLLAVPSPQRPVSGSDIVFKPGQSGWWFLRDASDGSKGVYLADHPQRFLAAGGDPARIASLKKALRAGK
jgi:hypothetical protein